MLRSSRRYQKQIRDEMRRQNGTQTWIGRASYNLRVEAARLEAQKAAQAVERAAAAEESLSAEIERLARLRDEGVLTHWQFEQAKQRVLHRPT